MAQSGDHGAGPGAVRGQDLVTASVNWEPKEGYVLAGHGLISAFRELLQPSCQQPTAQ